MIPVRAAPVERTLPPGLRPGESLRFASPWTCEAVDSGATERMAALSDSPYLDPPPAPRPLTGPPARGPVVVVAPHPDDEIIGPGGTLLLHRRLGDPVHVVVLTNGQLGDADPGRDPAAYSARREAESRAAARRLGAASIEFLGFPDGRRAREEDLGAVVPRLQEAFARCQPAVIYAPHPAEVHADHHVTALAVQRAARSLRGCCCFGYEIWTALCAEVVVDISDVMEEKLAIARGFESQTAHTDLAHFFGGLNAYRAVYLPKGARHGEAFCELRIPAATP